MKSEKTSIIEMVQDERDDGDEPMTEDLTEEELARLDRQMEETYLTGATPILDALSPGKDWGDEDLLERFYFEVMRRLGGADSLLDDHDLYRHAEHAFRRGHSEAQCVADWRARLS